MLIRFHCDGCGKRLKVDDAHAGARVKCPRCGAPLVVPREEPAAAASPKRRRSRKRTPAGQPVALPAEPAVFDFARRRAPDDELDMTPMVDVTFLLLIFFTMTSAFALQKSIEIPTPDRQEGVSQSRTLEEYEEDDDYVIVRIDTEDTIWVEDSEAPSRQELLSKLRELRAEGGREGGRSRLLVLASGDARHETVITALDAGNAVGMQDVRLSTFDEEEF